MDPVLSKILKSAMNELDPYLNNINVYSVSTLAYSTKKAIEYKLLGNSNHGFEFNLLMGKAIHKWIQEQFPEFSHEYKIINKYVNDKGEEIVIVGYVDMVDFMNNVVYEIKTSYFSDKVEDYMKLQVAYYAKALSIMLNRQFKAVILKINHKPQSYELSQSEIERGYSEIVKRAWEVYDFVRKVRHLDTQLV